MHTKKLECITYLEIDELFKSLEKAVVPRNKQPLYKHLGPEQIDQVDLTHFKLISLYCHMISKYEIVSSAELKAQVTFSISDVDVDLSKDILCQID